MKIRNLIHNLYAISKLYSHLVTINYENLIIYLLAVEFYLIMSSGGIETFVTRKVTKAVAKIKLGLMDSFKVGNLDAKRDWGHAKEYVEAMHLMLQQEKPGEFVIGTGKNYSVRYFIEQTFSLAGIEIEWKGQGINEKGINKANNKIVVEIDKFFFRPSEVDILLSDPRKAKVDLKWEAKTNIEKIIQSMYENDFNILSKL